MLNAATVVVGLIVLVVVVAAAYYVYRSFRHGGCEGCVYQNNKCDRTCGQCRKKGG